MLAPRGYGVALVREGRIADGIALLNAGIAVYEAAGGKHQLPTAKAFLVAFVALTGELNNALQLIDEQIVQMERPGREERLYYAEILRLRA